MSNNKYIKMVATTTGNYTMLPVILATVSYQLHVRSCYQLRVTGHSILPAACNKLLPAMFDRSHYFTTALHVTGHSILPAMCDRSQCPTSYVWQVTVSYQLCVLPGGSWWPGPDCSHTRWFFGHTWGLSPPPPPSSHLPSCQAKKGNQWRWSQTQRPNPPPASIMSCLQRNQNYQRFSLYSLH